MVLDRGSTLAEYLSERLRESVHKDYLEAIARRSKGFRGRQNLGPAGRDQPMRIADPKGGRP